MTKDKINEIIKFIVNSSYYSNKDIEEIEALLNLHPVMQEGKEDEGEGLEACPVCGHSMLSTYRCCEDCYKNNRFPTDDEQSE